MAKYTGKSKHFSIGNYINLLQGAFTDLESIGEGKYALTKKQKVSIFTKGLVAEEYAATKHSIYQNEETGNDFQKCYASVETMEQFKPYTLTQVPLSATFWRQALRKALTRDTILQLSGRPFPRRKRTRSCLPYQSDFCKSRSCGQTGSPVVEKVVNFKGYEFPIHKL
jgi:hypothetical protein